MEKNIEIQKKSRPVVIAFAIILLLGIGVFAIWLLIGVVFPMLEGFGILKITTIIVVTLLPLWAIYLIVQQSSKTKPGLIISKDGLTDFSNMMSVGFIPWSDITEIKEGQNELRQKLIIIIVKNPDTYINQSSSLKSGRKVQHMQFGSPIIISASTLEYDIPELILLLKARIKG